MSPDDIVIIICRGPGPGPASVKKKKITRGETISDWPIISQIPKKTY